MRSALALEQHEPVAVGGIGGGGTRVVAVLLRELGYHMGDDLNQAGDNLWYTLLFVRHDILRIPQHALAERIEIFVNAMAEGVGLSRSQRELVRSLAEAPVPHGDMNDLRWLHARAASLVEAAAGPPGRRAVPWGWKEPNTHVIFDRLAELLPRMRYVHVIRNGLDMAFSSNQNQLRFWGPTVLGLSRMPVDPRHALKYWCSVHRSVLATAGQRRFHLLNFEALCGEPEASIARLCEFLGVPVRHHELQSLAARVEAPPSIGRFRGHDLRGLDPEDVAYVGSLGFDTSP